MKSLRVSVFCLLPDLENWLLKACKNYSLNVLAYCGDGFIESAVVQIAQDPLQSAWERVFLFPTSQGIPDDLRFNMIRPKDWGWIDVSLGKVIDHDGERILTMTDIYSSLPEGSSDAESWKAARFIQREIRKEAQNDVTGRNLENGGWFKYSDIWYTSSAEDAFRDGVVLKQDPRFKVVFELGGAAGAMGLGP